MATGILDGQSWTFPDIVAPIPSVSRVISGAQFLALWTPAEIAAGIAADPRLLAGAFKAMAQNSVNLDSTELASLLALAVSKNALTAARATQIAAGQLPTP